MFSYNLWTRKFIPPEDRNWHRRCLGPPGIVRTYLLRRCLGAHLARKVSAATTNPVKAFLSRCCLQMPLNPWCESEFKCTVGPLLEVRPEVARGRFASVEITYLMDRVAIETAGFCWWCTRVEVPLSVSGALITFLESQFSVETDIPGRESVMYF